MKIPFVNLKKQYIEEKKNLLRVIDNTIKTGEWVGGSEIDSFEKKNIKAL